MKINSDVEMYFDAYMTGSFITTTFSTSKFVKMRSTVKALGFCNLEILLFYTVMLLLLRDK